MAITTTYIINGIDLTLTCGTGCADGINLHPDNTDLDDAKYIEAIKIGLSIYKVIHAYEWLNEMAIYEPDCYRLDTEKRAEIIDGWHLIEAHPEIEFDKRGLERIRLFVLNLAKGNSKTTKKEYRESPNHIHRAKPGYVYLLQSPTSSYKIGRTQDPDNRIKTFGIQLPFEVNYICLIKTDDMVGLEIELHERYADKRTSGEWFDLTQEDVDEIVALATKHE